MKLRPHHRWTHRIESIEKNSVDKVLEKSATEVAVIPPFHTKLNCNIFTSFHSNLLLALSNFQSVMTLPSHFSIYLSPPAHIALIIYCYLLFVGARRKSPRSQGLHLSIFFNLLTLLIITKRYYHKFQCKMIGKFSWYFAKWPKRIFKKILMH
jgi:hypothetical protein